MGDRDHRGELIRVRLSDEDLAKVSAIQNFYLKTGSSSSSLQRVVVDAVSAYYAALADSGVDIEIV